MVRLSPVRRAAVGLLGLVAGLAGLAAVPAPSGAAPAAAAPGDEVIAWLEVEDGVIAGGPGLNSGDHSNFSGTGSYTFRETGMSSTMTVTAPEAGTYPVWVRYAAGPLGADENVTRSMGLLTNGGSRQQLSYPMTSLENWEAWRFVGTEVTLAQGTNTIAVQCDRSVDFCRLNFDAIQVGGTSPDPCAATPATPGWTSLFDGTFSSFDAWRKGGAGGFGRQTDCTIRSTRGAGAEWFTTQQTGPYTLELDWRRGDANDDSSVYLASSDRGGATPVGGFQVPIGTDTGAIVPTGGTKQPPDAAALASALRPVGEWNTFTIRVTGSRIGVSLNGTQVSSLERSGTAPTAGFVGLENRSFLDTVDFRDIQVLPDVELGSLAAPFTRARLADGTTVNPGGESALGNLAAESLRWATRAPASGGAQIAFVSPTALAADLTTATYRQAALVTPSTDTLVNLRLTGAQLESVLEQQWQQPFLRLGTSAGLTYTYDPTAAAGSRITGLWLDGVAVAPGTSYSVTASSSLAAGGQGFTAFAGGTGRRTVARTPLAALTDYLDASARTAPLAPDAAQRSVGVTVPTGAPAPYAAGGTFAVDLTSLALTGPGDPHDAAIEVTLDGVAIGSFPVDGAPGSAADDEAGTAAVRATIPAGTPGGRATVTITGATTGTTVELPITVAALSTTRVSVPASAVAVGQGTVPVTVAVTAAGGPPSGQVAIYAGSTRLRTVTLSGGTATTRVGPFASAGRQQLTARYLGDATTGASVSPATVVTVRKATPKVGVAVSPRRVVAGTTRPTLTVTVRTTGFTASGKVRVKVGARTWTATLHRGRAAVRLPAFRSAGTVRAAVTYLGDARATSARTTARIVVVPRRG